LQRVKKTHLSLFLKNGPILTKHFGIKAARFMRKSIHMHQGVFSPFGSSVSLFHTNVSNLTVKDEKRQLKVDEFFKACEESNVEQLERLLKEDVSLSEEKMLAKGRVPPKESNVGKQMANTSEISSYINAMMYVCQFGFYEALQTLLKANGPKLMELDRVNKKEQGGFTALHSAIVSVGNFSEFLHTPNPPSLGASTQEQEIQYKKLQIQLYLTSNQSWLKCVQLLCENGADVNAPFSDTEYTPLMYAARHGLLQFVKLLLDYGADPNQRGSENQTPLNFAAAYGHSAVCQLLIAAGADPFLTDKNGDNFVKLAQEKNQPYPMMKIGQIMSHLKDRLTPERIATCRKIWFLDSSFSLDNDVTDMFGNTPLMTAAALGNLEAVNRLVDKGVNTNNINILGWTPLTWSLIHGIFPDVYNQKRIISKLLSGRADPNIATNDGLVPLCFAHDSQNIKLLVEEGQANINHKSPIDTSTPLIMLLSNPKCRTDAIKTMINANADVNYEMKDGTRPIFYACLRGHQEPVSLLIKAGAEYSDLVHKQTGQNLMLIAASRGYFDIVRILIQNNVDINYKSPNGMHTMFYAVHMGHEQTITLLLNLGLDVNIKMHELQVTPLHVAVMSGRPNIVKLLLENGADISATDNRGFTALEYATQKAADNQPNAKEIVQILEEYSQNKE
jgi:ankyrin repeat protein